jgi:DNA polymerase III epsilon subunit-like protein
MNYIVFDLEFNMFFPFKQGEFANPNLKSEIIQIGAVKLDENLEVTSQYNRIIRPVVYKRINPYVKKKTGINGSQIARGLTFLEAIKEFRSWMGDGSVLCSWGHDDILGLRDNCLFFGFRSLSLNKFINIQKLYMTHEKLAQQPSLESAVEALNIKKDAPFHDAFSDAVYTSDILKKVYDFSTEVIVNWEKQQAENELKIRELKSVLDKTEIFCPECGNLVQKDYGTLKPRQYLAYGYCFNCNLKIRHVSRIVHKNDEYSIFSRNTAVKTEESNEIGDTPLH